MTGMAAHGGVLPVGGTFFVFSDYMRPAVRLAALPEAHVIYSWTHDSVGLGEDGPTHQPVEHLAAMRAMPGLRVIRPADANETAHAWRIAVDCDGPTALDPVPPGRSRSWRGRPRRRRGRGPGRLRPRRAARRPARDRPHRHRQRGPRVPGRGRPAGRAAGIAGPGWCRCRRGTCSPCSPTPTGSGAPAGRAPPGRRGGGLVRVGAVRRRHVSHRPLRGVGPR